IFDRGAPSAWAWSHRHRGRDGEETGWQTVGLADRRGTGRCGGRGGPGTPSRGDLAVFRTGPGRSGRAPRSGLALRLQQGETAFAAEGAAHGGSRGHDRLGPQRGAGVVGQRAGRSRPAPTAHTCTLRCSGGLLCRGPDGFTGGGPTRGTSAGWCVRGAGPSTLPRLRTAADRPPGAAGPFPCAWGTCRPEQTWTRTREPRAGVRLPAWWGGHTDRRPGRTVCRTVAYRDPCASPTTSAGGLARSPGHRRAAGL